MLLPLPLEFNAANVAEDELLLLMLALEPFSFLSVSFIMNCINVM